MRFAAWSAVLVGLATIGVEGGHRAWEPPIHHLDSKAVLMSRDLMDVVTGNRTSGNISMPLHSHQKRVVSIQPHAHGSGDYPQLWPDGTITACFEQRQHDIPGKGMRTTREILGAELGEAYKLWTSAGIRFKFRLLNDNDARCNPNHGNFRNTRPQVLLISYAGHEVRSMRTDVGMVPGQSMQHDPRKWGPSMLLSNVVDMGMGNVVPNYAHELGHAWGLHHEHQNPRWWSHEFSDIHREKIYFDATSFHCDRLRDYQAARGRVVAANPNYSQAQIDIEMNKICREQRLARDRPADFFGAANILPIRVGRLNSVWDDGRSEPDWNSIMMYPSNCGGTVVNGVAQNVLTKIGGELITQNGRPTQRDVEGLKKLYSVREKFGKSLLNDPGNALKGAFDKMRKKDPDVPCL